MFEAQGIIWIDGSVLSEIKESLREIILSIESVKLPGQKLLISIEKRKTAHTQSFIRKNTMRRRVL